MKIETLQELIEWTRDTHKHLSSCLKHCSDSQEEQRAKWLLQYLADHEKTLAKTVEGFEKQADPRALHTWVYDYVGRSPIDPHRSCSAPYARMSFDEITTSILDVHNQVIDMYRYIYNKADIPEARDLAEDLLLLEENEAMLLAQQSNRLSDL